MDSLPTVKNLVPINTTKQHNLHLLCRWQFWTFVLFIRVSFISYDNYNFLHFNIYGSFSTDKAERFKIEAIAQATSFSAFLKGSKSLLRTKYRYIADKNTIVFERVLATLNRCNITVRWTSRVNLQLPHTFANQARVSLFPLAPIF